MGFLARLFGKQQGLDLDEVLDRIKDSDVRKICKVAVPQMLGQLVHISRDQSSLSKSPAASFLIGYIRGFCWQLAEVQVLRNAPFMAPTANLNEAVGNESMRVVFRFVFGDHFHETAKQRSVTEVQARRVFNLGVECGEQDADIMKVGLEEKLPDLSPPSVGESKAPFQLFGMFPRIEEALHQGKYTENTPDHRRKPYLYASGA